MKTKVRVLLGGLRAHAFISFVLLLLSCSRKDTEHKPIETATIVAASTAGPNCSAAGDPTVGVDLGFSCTGALAAATFTHALCACGTVQDSNSLTTDGFDSSVGGPTGGLGADVAANTGVSWSITSSIGGTLWTPGNLGSSNPSTVRGDLHLGGMLSGSGTFTVNGNAFVVKTLPSFARVLGTTTKVTSVATPCNCSNPLPVASITASHRAPNNDDAAIGLSATAYVGNNPARLDLPCGNYYLTQINAALPLTIAVHGHTALHVDGNLQASQTLIFQVDTGATLDLFVAGTFSAAQSLTLGSPARPESCRAFVGGTSFVTSGNAAYGCNVYAPKALMTLANNATVSGSLFAGNIQVSGNATVHYDKSILRAGGECCSSGTCDDGNPCTADSCNGDGTCAHSPVVNGTACSDGSTCTRTDTCQAGVCTGQNPIVCSASDSCHVAGTCNTSTGVCSNPPANNGTACSDGNACTRADTCQAGVCTGSNPITCTAQDQCHLPGTCNVATGVCSNPAKANGSACSDDNACTQTDTCQGGNCMGANLTTCAASDQCHGGGVCDPSTGACSNPAKADGTACSDGNACTQADACQSGVCTGGTPVVCMALDQCHATGVCNATTGACSNPARPNGTSCSDGNSCTQSDTCVGGTCAGSNPLTCSALDQCHVVGTCDAATGTCSNPALADGTTCSDGNACTAADVCTAGACRGASVNVDDANPCTSDSCDTATGIVHATIPNGAPCSDGNACNGAETCSAGVCAAGTPATVDDGNPCTADTCDSANGVVHSPVSAGTACAAGDPCAATHTCNGNGACVVGAPPFIDDGNPCTVDSCDSVVGVVHSPVAAGTSCSDGNPCNGAETCNAAAACTGGAPPPLDDNNPCTVDACDPAGGVTHALVTIGSACTPPGSTCAGTCTAYGGCAVGQCVATTSCATLDAGRKCAPESVCNAQHECVKSGLCPTDVSDNNPCTVDTCEPTTGVISHRPAPGASCGNGMYCNASTTCAALPPSITASVAAPAADRVTTFRDSVAFLYSGANARQTGVGNGVIGATCAAVLRGKIVDRANQPVAGVAISVNQHGEFGTTLSRADGLFDIAVNGGGLLSAQYEKEGYLPATRQVDVPCQDFVTLPDVVLSQYDPHVTLVALNQPLPQSALGSVVEDSSGTRQAAVYFPGNTTAHLQLQDGSKRPVQDLSVRLTEYTVGPEGPAAMPASLPVTSAYTYAVEITADEALATNAPHVIFDSPVVLYVDNFLGMPPGTSVPVGDYERDRACWRPSTSGRVVTLVVDGTGSVGLDFDGNGVADTSEAGASGATQPLAAELQWLAQRYALGTTLWRSELGHMSTFDCNWGPQLTFSLTDTASVKRVSDADKSGCEKEGCVLGLEDRSLGQRFGVSGTSESIEYSSRRTKRETLRFTLLGPNPSQLVLSVDLEIQVAGKRFTQHLASAPNLTADFAWDGLDAYSRPVPTNQTVSAKVTYNGAPGVYLAPKDGFGTFGDAVTIVNTRTGVAVSRTLSSTIRTPTPPSALPNTGGWALGSQRYFDAHRRLVYRPDGTIRRLLDKPRTVKTVAGVAYAQAPQGSTSDYPLIGDGGQATQASPIAPTRLAVGPDRSVYIFDETHVKVRRVDATGIITTVAGNGLLGCSGDGGPATEASVAASCDLALDCQGNLYIYDPGNARVRKVDRNGIITTVAGIGCYTDPGHQLLQGDESSFDRPAISVPLPSVGNGSIAAGPDCRVYVADPVWGLMSIDPDGKLRQIGFGVRDSTQASYSGPLADGIAIRSAFLSPYQVEISRAGEWFLGGMATNPPNGPYNYLLGRIVHLSPGGLLNTVQGGGNTVMPTDCTTAPCSEFDGILATQLLNPDPLGPPTFGIGSDSSVYFATTSERVLLPGGQNFLAGVAKVLPDGTIKQILGKVGKKIYASGDNNVAALQTGAESIRDIAFYPGALPGDDSFLFADRTSGVVRLVTAEPKLFTGSVIVPSDDGATLDEFDDESGQLIAVQDALTREKIQRYEYDDAGHLSAAYDAFNNKTTYFRNGAGQISEIVSPYNRATYVEYDASGQITSITNPAHEVTRFGYDANRMTSYTTPRNDTFTYGYDVSGNLVTDSDPDRGINTFASSDLPGSRTVTTTTALERASSYTRSVDDSGRATDDQVLALSNGMTATTTMTDASTRVTQLSSGLTETVQSSPDPRYQDTVPYASSVSLRAGSRERKASIVRTAVAGSSTDPLTINSMSQTVTVGTRVYQSAFDAQLDKLTLVSPAHRTKVIAFGQGGTVQSVSLPGMSPVTFAYDDRGRLKTRTFGSRTNTWEYDPNGYVSSASDNLPSTTQFSRDSVGRLLSKTIVGGPTWTFGRDANGSVTTITPPEQPAHGLQLNSLGQIVAYEPPLGSAIDVSYNADHQASSFTKGPDALAVTYEPATGRWSQITLPRQLGTVSYAYRQTGELLSVTGPDGATVTRTYDPGLLVQETATGPVSSTVKWNYGADFTLSSITRNGRSVAFSYDADQLLTRAGALTLGRDPASGRVTTSTIGGAMETRGYDPVYGEQASRSVSISGTGLYSVSYVHDAIGRLQSKTETVQNAVHVFGYTYDATGRLTSVTQDGQETAHYTYSGNGNRIHRASGSQLETGSYDTADRISSYGEFTYTWDSADALRTKTKQATGETTTYMYDALGSLRNVALPTGTAIQYLVDGLGRRVAVVKNGVVQRKFVYDGARLALVLDAQNQITAEFVYAGATNAPEYMVGPNGQYLLIKDHLGSVRLVADTQTAQVVQRLDYDEFGRVLADTNPGFQPFGFAGGLYDPDTGLVRFGARDYDATLGRWTAKDPILFAGGDTNLYVYAGGDPVNNVDPSGHIIETAWDIASVGMDIYNMSHSIKCGSGWQVALDAVALGIDALAVALPFVPAVGAVLTKGGRAAKGAEALAREAHMWEGAGQLTHSGALDANSALEAGARWVGEGYTEVYPGVFRSADESRQFRMMTEDIAGAHGEIGPHVHFESLDPLGHVIENNHVPLFPEAL